MNLVDLGPVNDFGLVSVLPPFMYIGLALLAVAFGAMLARERFPTWLAVGLVILTIFMLYGVAPAIEGELRFAPAWRHLGLVEFMSREGLVRPSLDAYHNWPGLFGLIAFVSAVTGVTDLVGFATWAPVWFNLMFLPALMLVVSALTDDRHILWLSIWLFYLTDWIGQDYFAPQAVGFFLFLVVLAMLLRWLGHRELRDPSGDVEAGRFLLVRRFLARILDVGPMPASALSPVRRAALMGLLLAVFVFMVASHQLSPFFVVAAAAALFVLRRVPWATLPAVMVMIIATWVTFLAVAFLIGHFQNVAGYVGTLAESLAANLTSRLQGSPDHVAIIYVRIGATIVVWALAAIGLGRRLLQGRWDVVALALAAAPFPLFLVQAYGGEMLLRIYFFALPFVAFFIACAVLPKARQAGPTSMATLAIVSVLGLALMGSLMLTRYGNERLEHFTADEIAAVSELYRIAPEGSLLVGLTPNLPWKNQRYEQYRYKPSGDDVTFGDVEVVLNEMRLHEGNAYLILSRSQQAYVEMILGAGPGEWDAFERALMATGEFSIIFENDDAMIARFTG
ncbi:MAG: hypothetical protein ABWY52_04395 [Candidatus Limnocylindrales bacterium]